MNHADRGHSVLGASAAYRWMNCPGSVKMLKENPQPTSPAASDGTLTHELAELVLLDLLNGQSTEGRREEHEADRFDRAMFYADIVKEKFAELNLYGDAQYAVEKSFQLPHDDRFFGTNDAAIWSFEELHVFDLKDGFAEVKAENNPQLMYYALGILSELDFEPDQIFVHIVMPRHNSHDTWEVDKGRLNAFIDELKEGATRVDVAPDECTSGEWCKFCAKTVCPAFQKDIEEKALVAFDDDAQLPDLSALSFDKLRVMLDYEARVIQMFKEARQILHDEAMTGTEIENYKVVKKFGNRRWADPDAVASMGRRWGLKKAQLFEEKLKSPAQLQRLGVPKLELDKFTERPDNGTELVHMSKAGEPLQLGEANFDKEGDL